MYPGGKNKAEQKLRYRHCEYVSKHSNHKDNTHSIRQVRRVINEIFLFRAICKGAMMPISRATRATSNTMLRIVIVSHHFSCQVLAGSGRICLSHLHYLNTLPMSYPMDEVGDTGNLQ